MTQGHRVMSGDTLPWLRLYTHVLNDPKVQSLPSCLFKAWINVLCIARIQNGNIPDLNKVAFHLRLKPAKAKAILDKLKSAGLLDEVDGVLSPHNWRGRQYDSDSSTQRVRSFRERQQGAKRNVSGNVSEASPETETETETETDAEVALSDDIATPSTRTGAKASAPVPSQSKASGKRQPSGRPIPDFWRPNQEHIALAAKEGVDLRDIEGLFRDYVANNPTKYCDHDAAFRNFIRNQKNFRRGLYSGKTAPHRTTPKLPGGGTIVAAGRAASAELDRQIAALEAAESRDGRGNAAVRELPAEGLRGTTEGAGDDGDGAERLPAPGGGEGDET